MNTLQNSLRCLKNPATIVSIALLLINDHVLKILAPSFLTGKLSDFAGLFFFPFLLAMLLSAFRLSTCRAGGIAFASTAIWFTLVKTSTLGITLTQELFRPLLGYVLSIVLDPTDLIALIVLIPAWRLWNCTNETSHLEHRDARSWLLLGLASLAVIATSSPPPIVRVDRVLETEDQIFARAGIYVLSSDGGKTWQETKDVPPELKDNVQLPRVVCEQANSVICYRTGSGIVERSRDGGKTWEVVWSIPWGRQMFMNRVAQNTGVFGPHPKEIDLGPYDLALIKPIGINRESTLIVALGNEGILIRTPDGNWTRHTVWNAQPTPFSALEEPTVLFKSIQTETDFATVAGLLTLLLTTFWGTRDILARSKQSISQTMFPLFIFVVLYTIGVLLWYWSGLAAFGPFLFVPTLLFSQLTAPFLFVLFAFLFGVPYSNHRVWKRAESEAINSQAVWSAAKLSIGLSVGVSVLTFMPMLLWALGIIPVYEIALLLIIILLGILLYFGFRHLQKLSKDAIKS